MVASRVWVSRVAGLVAVVLVAAGCGPRASMAPSAGSLEDVAVGLPSQAGNVTEVAVLPSAVPGDGFAGGGGGLVGVPVPVWGLPGSRGVSDPGVASSVMPVLPVMGLQPQFTALAGAGSYEFVVSDVAGSAVVWDSGSFTAAGTGDCAVGSVVVCTLPSGKVGQLRNGGTYRVQITAGGVSQPWLFQVNAGSGLAGAQSASVQGNGYRSSVGSSGLAVGFSSADQGPVAGTAVTDGARWGLPAGWSWSGPAGGFSSVKVQSNSDEYAGYTTLVTVRMGAQSQTLGCTAGALAQTWVCGVIGSPVIGEGLAATIAADGSVTVADQGAGQVWTFDAAGQLTGTSQPGSAPIAYGYRQIPGGGGTPVSVLSTVGIAALGKVWTLAYSGDPSCASSGLPDGLVSAPPGYACGWSEPSGDQVVLMYSQPAGATVPRLSRALGVPAACPQWASCDVSLMNVTDFGWDDSNRLVGQRSGPIAQAIAVGNVSGTDASYWTAFTYDDASRVSTVTAPLVKAGVGATVTTLAYGQAAADQGPATRSVTTTRALADGPTLSSSVAFDDAGRQYFSTGADGVVTSQVWDVNKPLVYGTTTATTTGTTSVTGTSYDQFGRATATASGPAQAFDTATCQPGVSSASNSSCMPVSPNPAVAATLNSASTYDSANATGNGLRVQMYTNAQLSGVPASTTVAKSGAGGAGFTITPPAKAARGWGAALSGGIVLDHAGSWNITVQAPAGMAAGGLFVGGTLCAVLGPQAGSNSGSCSFPSDGSTYPLQLNLSHAPTSGHSSGSGGPVVIAAQWNPFKPATSANSLFLPYWGAVATSSATDHTSNGDPITTVTSDTYSSPLTASPTATAVTASDGSGATMGSRTTFVSDQFGGASASSTTASGGLTRKITYWGLAETPASLPNAGQIPAQYQNVAQGGLSKITTNAAGHQQWTVYDGYGQPVCTAAVTKATAPAWSCQDHDAAPDVSLRRWRAAKMGKPTSPRPTATPMTATPTIRRSSARPPAPKAGRLPSPNKPGCGPAGSSIPTSAPTPPPRQRPTPTGPPPRPSPPPSPPPHRRPPRPHRAAQVRGPVHHR